MKNYLMHPVVHAIILLLLSLTLPARAEVQLNGMAMHSKLGQDQFIAAIYSETLTDSAQELLNQDGDVVMELRVAADQLYPRRFKRMWVESIAINSSSAVLQQQAQNMADFANLLKVRLRAGDVVRIEKLTGQGVRVLVDGHELGTIDDPSFFNLLLPAWIGSVPLSTDFKNGLLAKGEVDKDLASTFYATSPDPQRVAAVGEALAALKQEEQQPVTVATEETEAADSTNDEAPAVAAATATAAAATNAVEGAAESAVDATADAAASTEAVAGADADAAEEAEPAEQAPDESTQTVATASTGLLSEDDLFGDDAILEGEDEETITAESLLSEQLYIAKLTRWTSGFVNYPRNALRRGREGTVMLLVTINRAGEVISLEYEEESSYRSLNKAAYEAVEEASPFPAIPPSIKKETYVFTVPVVFRLQ